MSLADTQPRFGLVPLGDCIASLKNGIASGKRSDTGVLQIRMNNVDRNGNLDLAGMIRIPADPSEVADFALQPDDVVLNNTNSTELVGKSALFPGHNEPVLFSNHFTRIRVCTNRLLPAYLARWLTHQQQRGVFSGLCNRWVNQSAVRKESLLTLSIPLPHPGNASKSLAEQRRIAAILDKASAIHRKRRQVLGITDELIPSLFNDAFSKWLDQPASGMPQLGDPELAEVVSGVTKGRHFNGQATVTVPYIRVANVQDGYLDLSEIKTIEALPSDVQSLSLQRGDVLMTEGGDFDKLGRGAMYDADIPDCIHQNHVFRVRCNRSRMLPIFFATYIRTQFAKAYFLKCAKKTSNLASINMTQLRALPVACPPIDVQKRFAKEVAVIHRVRRQQVELADHADDLFGSLVQRAFRGEL